VAAVNSCCVEKAEVHVRKCDGGRRRKPSWRPPIIGWWRRKCCYRRMCKVRGTAAMSVKKAHIVR